MQRVALALLLRITGLTLFFSSTSLLAQQTTPYGSADPVIRDPGRFDVRRPVVQELGTRVGHDFTLAVVGDLIISRPVSQSAERLPGFAAVLGILHGTDASAGNMESTIFDARSFKGAPYSWDGDWTNSSLPEVAKDLRTMGFTLVSRANNHALDWGLEGMRETTHHLDDAGIVHAGVGKASFTEAALVDNVRAFVGAITRAKPSGVKGTYINRVSVSSTMGPGVKVDLAGLAEEART